MCLNSEGGKWQQTIFFQKFFEKGGKMIKGENDRGYYGKLIFIALLCSDSKYFSYLYYESRQFSPFKQYVWIILCILTISFRYN